MTPFHKFLRSRTVARGELVGWLVAVLWLSPFFAIPAIASDAVLLWQIGRSDNDNREFALAPNHYDQFREDGFFVVGSSDPARDWPYVHPGPADGWAGGRAHTFTVMFGLRQVPENGTCKLRIDLVDTQRGVPPKLQIAVNGQGFLVELPPGAGDASVFGDPSQGREHVLDYEFPVGLFKAGANEISVTTRSGSWLLYDWLGFESPPGMELAPVEGTAVGTLQSPAVLIERDGQMMQTVNVPLRHFGTAAEATVRIDGAAPLNVTLQPGAMTLEVQVPAVQTAQMVHAIVEIGGKEVASQTVELKPVRRWVVYLLPHSHVDIGYTHVQTEVEQAQWKYLEMAMEAARKSASYPPGSQFKWNVEVLWAVDSYLQQATPEKREQFVEAVKAGQVGLQALYGNELTGLCRPEELLRLLSCAQSASKLCETPISSAMITDVPGYTWGMVPALAHSGVRYFSIGPNGGDRIGHTTAAWGDRPFWWIGPNGLDRILVWMTGTGYYRVFSSADNLMQYLASLEEKGYPYDFVQVRHCLGDNGAPDVNFADTVKEWNETYAFPKLVIATTDDMFRDFEQRYGDTLPTAQGDFTPYWEDGAASSALETSMNRASADRLTQAETLFALLNPQAYPQDKFRQAWRNVILYDEHTWGAHNSISQPDEAFVKSQWAIKRQFAVDADRQSKALVTDAVASRGNLTPAGSAPSQMIDVVNTNADSYPWTLVAVPRDLSTAGDAVKIASANTDAPIVSQRLTTGELVFRVCMGGFVAQRFQITNSAPLPTPEFAVKAEGSHLMSRNSSVAAGLTVRIDDQTGAIASLRYRDRELVDPKAASALNDYFYLPGSDLKGVERNGPVKIAVKETGPLIASLLVECDAPGCHRLTREYRLHALRNYLEIIDTVDKQAVRTKEGVHFGFGFQVPDGTVRMDVPWGVVRPELDQIPGACKNWFTVQRYVDISNQDFGVTLLTPDAPLMQFGGITANLIGSLSDPKAWLDQLEPSCTVYSWAMNNHWHTNYRAEQEGPTTFRYVIWPHEHPDEIDRVAHHAMEYSQPVVVWPARGDFLAPRRFYLSGDVQCTAYKPSEDGKAVLIRLYGGSGEDQSVAIQWDPIKPAKLWLSDNSEEPREEVSGAISVPAWSVVTLRAEFAE